VDWKNHSKRPLKIAGIVFPIVFIVSLFTVSACIDCAHADFSLAFFLVSVSLAVIYMADYYVNKTKRETLIIYVIIVGIIYASSLAVNVFYPMDDGNKPTFLTADAELRTVCNRYVASGCPVNYEFDLSESSLDIAKTYYPDPDNFSGETEQMMIVCGVSQSCR